MRRWHAARNGYGFGCFAQAGNDAGPFPIDGTIGCDPVDDDGLGGVGLQQLCQGTDESIALYDVVYNQARAHMSTTMTIRLDDDVKDRLDVLAEATQRSKSFLAAEAIRAFVETNEWQIGEIQAALKEADAGDFASDKDVAALAKKWKVNAR